MHESNFPNAPAWKFRSVGQMMDMLKTRQLWFSSRMNLNDPDDLSVDLLGMLERVKGELKNYGRMQELLSDRVPYYEQFLDSLFIYCVSCQKGAEARAPYLDTRMWAYYADSHRGVCVGLNLERIKTKLRSGWLCLPEGHGSVHVPHHRHIEYSQETLVEFIKWVDSALAFGADQVNLIVRRFVYYKFQDWAHESEYRHVHYDPSMRGEKAVKLGFDGADVEDIIFGINTPKEQEEEVAELVRSSGWGHVRLWKMQRSRYPGEFLVAESTA